MSNPTHLAKLLRRAAARLLDSLFILSVFLLILFALGGPADVSRISANPGAALMLRIGLVVSSWLYFSLLESSRWQATIGKRMVEIVVTDLNGQRISFLRATGRYFAATFLSGIFLLGFLLALFTRRRQTLHDLIAGTLVMDSILKASDARPGTS